MLAMDPRLRQVYYVYAKKDESGTILVRSAPLAEGINRRRWVKRPTRVG